ncbi:zf-HC2 domain-containing protein [Limnobacter sp.]|uniref:anti-sigma factor family protein n=1 Tax=Limnobacter sp. TaxID=2003368 RepID=UPI0035255A92
MKMCREITQLMSESQDRDLNLSERFVIRTHTWICSGCSEFDQQMQLLRDIAIRFRERNDESPED